MSGPYEPLDLAGPLREAVLSNSNIVPLLGVWHSEPAVFTTQPTPDDAPYPLLLVSSDISISDQDFLTGRLPYVRRDLRAFGMQPDDYMAVEAIGYMLRTQFHRKKFSLTPDPAYAVIDIVCTGPIPAPTDDDRLLGRAVLLQIRLKELAT